MSERLHIPADRVPDVASAALVSKLTVLRYRRRNGDGTPACRLLRATEAAITKAARELPTDAQLEIPSVGGRQPSKRLSRVSLTMGQPGEIRFCPPGLGDCTSPTPGTTAETSPTIASVHAPPPKRRDRCHVTLLVVGPDGSESEVRA